MLLWVVKDKIYSLDGERNLNNIMTIIPLK